MQDKKERAVRASNPYVNGRTSANRSSSVPASSKLQQMNNSGVQKRAISIEDDAEEVKYEKPGRGRQHAASVHEEEVIKEEP